MTLAEWSEAMGLTDREVADMLTRAIRRGNPRIKPVSIPAVQKYRTGRAVPGRDRMAAIVAVTCGWVQPNDFYGADA